MTAVRPEQPTPDYVPGHGLLTAKVVAVTAAAGAGSFEFEGATYWHAAGEPPAAGSGRVDLIQVLDELVMGYSESRHLLSGGLVWGEGVPVTYFHAVLSDGRLIGHWTYERDGRGRPSLVLTQALRAWADWETEGVRAAVADFGRFADSAADRPHTPSRGQ